MDFRLVSPNSRAVAAQRRRAGANPVAMTFFQGLHHKKKGWVRPVDIKMLLINTLRVNISDQEFATLMSTPLYISLFSQSGTKRSSLKQLRIKMEKSNKASVRIPREKRSTARTNSVSASRAHTILKKCVLSSCRKEWYTEPMQQTMQQRTRKGYCLAKPVAPNAFGKRKNLLDFDLDGCAAKTLRWYTATGSSSLTNRRSRTSYGVREYKPRDLRGGGAKVVLDWDAVGKRTNADQAQLQVADTMRIHFGSITKAFHTADADKSGCLSPRELRCMLTRMGISVSDNEFNQFLDKYDDVMQDGKIDFQEFASKFGGKSHTSLSGMGSPKRKSRYFRRSCRFSAEQALQLLAKKLKSHFRNVTAAFRSSDKNKDGRLSWLELRDILQQWQIAMSDSEYMRLVQMVTDSFGTGQRTSCITLEQFKKSVLGNAVAAAQDPGLLDRHKNTMIMHGIRNKKRSAQPNHTSLPGLGDSEENSRRRPRQSHRRASPKANARKDDAEKIVLPTII